MKKRAINLAIKDIEKAPEDHDWINTPLYKECYTGLTELASLMKTNFALLMQANIKQKKMELGDRHNTPIGEVNTSKPLNDEELLYFKTGD